MSKVIKVDSCAECRHAYFVSSSGEHACYKSEQFSVVGDGSCIPDWCPLPDDNSETLKAERDALHAILIESVAVVGGSASQESSVEFLSDLPSEILIVINGLKSQLAELKARTEWRTMESASNGDDCLVAHDLGGELYDSGVAWMDSSGCWIGESGEPVNPYAWMPRPIPPDRDK